MKICEYCKTRRNNQIWKLSSLNILCIEHVPALRRTFLPIRPFTYGGLNLQICERRDLLSSELYDDGVSFQIPEELVATIAVETRLRVWEKESFGLDWDCICPESRLQYWIGREWRVGEKEKVKTVSQQ